MEEKLSKSNKSTDFPLVIYIIGNNRCGSTLLDYLLSCHPGAHSVGELRHLHSYYLKNEGMGVLYDWKCSCGETVQDCQFWSEIMDRVSFSETFYTQFWSETKTNKMHYLNLFKELITGRYIADEADIMNGKTFAENTWTLYKEIFKQTGKNIIIDSSKSGIEAYFLHKYRRGNIKFIILERELSAIANSKYNHTLNLSEDIKEYWNPGKNTIYARLLSSYRVRKKNRALGEYINNSVQKDQVKTIDYLELTRAPEKTIQNICDFLQVQQFPVPSFTGKNAEIGHTLCGSPSRFKKREITPDTKWKTSFKKRPAALLLGKILEKL